MSALVVQAHPQEHSYNAALLDAVVAQLPSATVVRLGQGDQMTNDTFVGVTKLVAVYPTWWGSVPAALLGPLHEILGPWVEGDEPQSSSPLASVASITAVTTHGSSKLVNQLQGEPGMRLWKSVILPRCAPSATFHWHALYKMDRTTDRDRSDFLAALKVT